MDGLVDDVGKDVRQLDLGSDRAAAVYSLLETVKLNDIDPQAWFTDAKTRIVDHLINRIDELLHWCFNKT